MNKNKFLTHLIVLLTASYSLAETRIELYTPEKAKQLREENMQRAKVGVPRYVTDGVVGVKNADQKPKKAVKEEVQKFYMQATLLECIPFDPTKKPQGLQEDEVLSHEACGGEKAEVLLQDTFWAPVGQSTVISKTILVQTPRNVPEVTFSPENGFVLKHGMSAEKEIEWRRLTVHVLEQKDNSLNIALKTHVKDFVMAEDVVRHNDDKVYLNPRTIARERIMVDTTNLSPARSSIASGDIWMLTPLKKAENENFPERDRLWLELKLVKPE